MKTTNIINTEQLNRFIESLEEQVNNKPHLPKKLFTFHDDWAEANDYVSGQASEIRSIVKSLKEIEINTFDDLLKFAKKNASSDETWMPHLKGMYNESYHFLFGLREKRELLYRIKWLKDFHDFFSGFYEHDFEIVAATFKYR